MQRAPSLGLATLLSFALAPWARPDDVSASAPAATPEALALADEALDDLESPESRSFMQSCSRRTCSPTQLSPYFFPRGEMRITSTCYGRLRAIRPAVLQRIGERLLGAIRAGREIDRMIVAGDHYLAGHHEHLLAILIDLNAVELLPLLLEALVEAERLEMPIARLQVLSTITGILRQEGYRPLLESELELRFGEALVAHWKERQERDGSALARARANGTLDPVHDLPRVHGRPLVLIELTPALRARIETWARDFLAATPVEQRKGPAAMLARPATR